MAPVVKNPPASAGDTGDMGSIPGSGTSPGEVMAAHSSILAWRVPQRSLAGYRPWGRKELDMTERFTHVQEAQIIMELSLAFFQWSTTNGESQFSSPEGTESACSRVMNFQTRPQTWCVPCLRLQERL